MPNEAYVEIIKKKNQKSTITRAGIYLLIPTNLIRLKIYGFRGERNFPLTTII